MHRVALSEKPSACNAVTTSLKCFITSVGFLVGVSFGMFAKFLCLETSTAMVVMLSCHAVKGKKVVKVRILVIVCEIIKFILYLLQTTMVCSC
jgi:hypothetical protein